MVHNNRYMMTTNNNNNNGIPYSPLIRFHSGRHIATIFAYKIMGKRKYLDISGYLVAGASGKTIQTPPLSSASKDCSNALPTSSTVNTRKYDFFSSLLIVVVSLTNSVSANQGHSAYAFILSSSHGFGRPQFA